MKPKVPSRRGLIDLVLTVVLAGLSAPLVKWLVMHGGELGVSQPDAISFCNLLFVGNFCAGVVVLFFAIALYFYGPQHFVHAFAADLWVVMLVYAAAVVVLGQVTWFRALDRISPSTVSVFITLTPVVGILFAYALLHEVPDRSQWIGSAIILTGVGIAQIAGRRREGREAVPVDRCLSG